MSFDDNSDAKKSTIQLLRKKMIILWMLTEDVDIRAAVTDGDVLDT